MTRVSPADLLLWRRCRRQWLDTCIDNAGLRQPAYPVGMTAEAAAREQARIGAAFAAVSPGADLFDGIAGPVPLVASWDAALASDLANRWHVATIAALEARSDFLNGLLATETLVVPIDSGRFSPRTNGWEFAIARAATGIRGGYIDEGAAILAVADALSIPVTSLRLYYLDKQPVESAATGFRESNLLARARRRTVHVAAEVGDLVACIEGRLRIDDSYRCRQGCGLCVPRSDAVPDRFSVFTLHKGAQLAREFAGRGETDIRSLDTSSRALSAKQRIQIEAVRGDRLYVDRRKLQRFLNSLRYPVFYLDFEAYAPALPAFSDLGPYEHTPVVASVHTQAVPGGAVRGESFAASPGRDDRIALFDWLQIVCGTSGSIVVFSKGFESSMIGQLALVAGEVEVGAAMVERMVDLLEPFADFAVYHPDQLGKVSLKRVLPAFTDDNYDNVAVRDGMHANLGYTRLADREGTRVASDPAIRAGAHAAEALSEELASRGVETAAVPTVRQITEYCAVDTIAMARLVSRLTALMVTDAVGDHA